MRRLVLAAVAVAVAAALAAPVNAIECDGIALPDGCLFTITGGDTPYPNDGFPVTNADGVPMWDFVREQDRQAVGYPISQRWSNGPVHLAGLPESDSPVGSRQAPHELVQHPRRPGQQIPRHRPPKRAPSPNLGGGPGRHHFGGVGRVVLFYGNANSVAVIDAVLTSYQLIPVFVPRAFGGYR